MSDGSPLAACRTHSVERGLPPEAGPAPGWTAATFGTRGLRRVWLWGHADLRDYSPVLVTTPFRWFSVTKLVTATALFALADRGLLSIDDTVAQHVPWFRPVPSHPPVTLRHLLAHTAGLVSPLAIGWVQPPDLRRRAPEQLVRETYEKHRALRSTPGERAVYTNLGYLLLGEVVRRVTQLSFAEHVRRSVLAPAGIATAGFEPRGAVGHERLRSLRTAAMAAVFLPRTRRLVAYQRDGWVGLTHFEIEGQAYGGLVGSLEDLVRIGRLHLGEGSIDGVRVISREHALAMREPQGDGPLSEFGLGLFRFADGWLGHDGEAGGYRATLRFHPQRRVGVAVLANAGAANVAQVAEALGRIA